jgi:hypothetical protein
VHRDISTRRSLVSALTAGGSALLLSFALVACGTDPTSPSAERHAHTPTPSATLSETDTSEDATDRPTTEPDDADPAGKGGKGKKDTKDAGSSAPKPAKKKDAEASDGKKKPGAEQTALAELDSLPVKGRAPKTGYDRESFRWRDDVDHNGCDTRNDVLRRDLSDIVLKPDTKGCVVLIGTLEDSPYSGKDVHFHQQDDNNLDIDHVVALSAAWQTGAGSWSDDQRREFANDPRNLLAVESSLNRQKGDGDAATWLPPKKSARCDYVARQIGVKHDYDLWVTRSEKDAMTRVLSSCDDPEAFDDSDDAVGWPGPGKGDGAREATAKEMRAGDSVRGGASSSGGKQRSSSGGASDRAQDSSKDSSGGDVSYKNCDAVRAAGKAPIRRGEPGYAEHLDRDGDGVGCE